MKECNRWIKNNYPANVHRQMSNSNNKRIDDLFLAHLIHQICYYFLFIHIQEINGLEPGNQSERVNVALYIPNSTNILVAQC